MAVRSPGHTCSIMFFTDCFRSWSPNLFSSDPTKYSYWPCHGRKNEKYSSADASHIPFEHTLQEQDVGWHAPTIKVSISRYLLISSTASWILPLLSDRQIGFSVTPVKLREDSTNTERSHQSLYHVTLSCVLVSLLDAALLSYCYVHEYSWSTFCLLTQEALTKPK